MVGADERFDPPATLTANRKLYPPMFPQHKAITRLLLDDDLATVELTKQLLLEGGATNIPDLLDLMAGANGMLVNIIRELLTAIEETDAPEEFTKTSPSLFALDYLEYSSW